MSQLIEKNLVIRPKRSVKKIIFFVAFYCFIIMCVAVTSLYFGYKYGNDRSGNSVIVFNGSQKDHVELKAKYDVLLANEARLIQSQNVQKYAYTELEKSYELIDHKNEFLNRRVNFYRSILSPDDGVSGVRIHDVSLREEGGELYFEIVLIQSINHVSKATAKVYVELFETKQSSKPIVTWKASSHDFKFKFSEVVQGSLKVKESLSGKFLKVIVLPSGDSSRQLVEWHKV